MRSLQQLGDLTGRKAVITGAAGHIGLAAGETLIELGADLALLDLDERSLSKRAAELGKNLKNEPLAIACDLHDESSTRRVIADVTEKLSGLDILVHCAAYVGTTKAHGWAVPFDKQSVEAWDNALRVNLTSAFVMVQEGSDALSYSGHGSVIFMGSIYGMVGPDMGLYEDTDMAHPAAYPASKGGLLQLTRYLSTVLAPKVRVNSISPGGVWRGQPDNFHQRYKSRTPMARMAVEEDLKGAIAYLASDLSSYVTGQNICVDGGWMAW